MQILTINPIRIGGVNIDCLRGDGRDRDDRNQDYYRR